MKIFSWALSDTGQKRERNEDNFLVSEELGLFAVADGMGGHKGGARASELALSVLQNSLGQASSDLNLGAEQLLESLPGDLRASDMGSIDTMPGENESEEEPATQDVEEDANGLKAESEELATQVASLAVRRASCEVFRESNEDPSVAGMGTTLTAMWWRDGHMHLVHAGDSRAYLLRDGRIRQLTQDHSWTAEQVRAGMMTEDEAEVSEFKHVITRSIGFEPDVEVDCDNFVVQPGDCFLLCSDGLSNLVREAELQEIMAESWYSALPQILVDLANERGGDDNITVVVMYAANQDEGAFHGPGFGDDQKTLDCA